MRWFALILLVILLLLQLKLWVGEGGVRDLRELQTATEEQRRENRELEERNDALMAEVEDLREGQEAVEERARSDLGMIRDDEVFYQVVEDEPLSEADTAEETPPDE